MRRTGTADDLRHGQLAPFFGEGPEIEVGAAGFAAAADSHAVVFSGRRLHAIADYRGALQAWFRAVRTGGHLIVTVPHAFLHDRLIELPSPRSPEAQRLYTPAALMGEVEEALAPNSYRVRLLADADDGYDYTLGRTREPVGQSDVVLVLEKIAPPAWPLMPVMEITAAAPDYAFEPARTRIEAPVRPAIASILILKLDHMGDFIMGIAALERTRALFPHARITLVVGSWNVETARALGVADVVIGFDAFPRNSSEQEVDVPGKAALFQDLIADEYDLAIDLRTDTDTRTLLKRVKARYRAGVGTAAQFPFLDIFLPLDFNRNRPETAREYQFDHHAFISQGPVERRDYRLVAEGARLERHCAAIWGPYRELRPGRYVFEPHLEIDAGGDGLLLIDVALDTHRIVQAIVPSTAGIRLPFVVEKADSRFEFRVWTVEDLAAPDFAFYGGRLIREGGGSVLHQSEYGALLIELIAIRLARTGLLAEVAAA